jgi:phospholipid/cholesterol/gamma-HCH transport system substrate-binding protein
MDKSRLEMKVGLFVLVALAVLAGLLVQFSKGNSVFHGTYSLKLHSTDVGGLKLQSGVLLAGVNVGNVKDIEIDPSGTNVTITLQIYKRYPIYGDARFVIEASGFLGDEYVGVIPTANALPPLTDGQNVVCQPPFNLQEVARGAAGFIQRLDDTAKKLDASVTDLRAEVLNAQTLANFGSAVTNLRVVTEQAVGTVHDLRAALGTNDSQVTTVVSNFVLFSTQLTSLGSSASNLLATNGVNLTAATRNIQDLTASAQQLVTDVRAGHGLAGTLLQNPQLSTNVQALAENLSIASSNLNRFGLWHFLWSHPADNKPVKPVTLESPPIRK